MPFLSSNRKCCLLEGGLGTCQPRGKFRGWIPRQPASSIIIISNIQIQDTQHPIWSWQIHKAGCFVPFKTMSTLCPASSSLLNFREEDLENLGLRYGDSKQDQVAVEREIDIGLCCDFISDGPGNADCKLAVTNWKNGASDLCGSCSFCNLLSKSMERKVESDLWDAWHIGSKLDPTLFPRPLVLQADVRFEELEYRKDHKPRTVENTGLRSVRDWDVFLLLLTGYFQFIQPKAKKMKRIKVDLAFELFGEKDDPVIQLLNVHRRPLNRPRLSDQNVAKLRHWIIDCDQNHQNCWPGLKYTQKETYTEETTFLPTRMIDVGGVDRHPRLIITSEMQPETWKDGLPKYMALSYCWGSEEEASKLLKTTHSTIASRTQKIEFDTMPQTFKDAVMVARALDIQYMWVDSLCIIQGDARDWQSESSKMAEIFSNAYLTLAAAYGSSYNDGFLDQSLPDPTCTVSVKIKADAAIEGQISLRFRRRWGTSDKMSHISSSRWVTRGWTFQEERLSRRILLYGENKFFLDCRTLERAEDSTRHSLRPDWVTSIAEGPFEEDEISQSDEVGGRWNHWQTLCTHYAHRKVRFPEDKLPAISGMASKIAKKVQSEYLAGLWKNNLVHDLFWHPSEPPTKPKGYRAPSWSWASLDGRFRWPSWDFDASCNKCTMYCTILEAKTIPLGLDPYGAVEDGFLKVQGILEEIKAVRQRGSGYQNSWRLLHNEKEIGIASLAMEVHCREVTYQALLMAKCNSPEESKPLVRGLLLEKNGHKRENLDEFTRVGTFTLFSSVVPSGQSSFSACDVNEGRVILIV